jgi:hypothetical protein
VEFIQPLGEPFQDPGFFNSLSYNGAVEVAVKYEMPEDGCQFLSDAFRPVDPATGLPVTHDLWRFVSRRRDWDVTSQTIPSNQLVYAKDTTKPLKEPGGKILASGTHYYKWWQLPLLPTAGPDNGMVLPGKVQDHINACVGTMNSVAFDNYPPFTLLCLAPKEEYRPQADGTWTVNLTYVFAQRGTLDVTPANGVMDITDTTTPNWTRILNNAGTYSTVVQSSNHSLYVYGTSNFYDLFRVA